MGGQVGGRAGGRVGGCLGAFAGGGGDRGGRSTRNFAQWSVLIHMYNEITQLIGNMFAFV